MVKGWYVDYSNTNNADYHRNPPHFVTVQDLNKLGVSCHRLEPNNYETDLQKVRQERGYHFADQIVLSKQHLPDYDQVIKRLCQEHIHREEEIRYIVDGYGYFELRDLNDEWIRVLMEPGDLLIIPAGLYHRYAPHKGDYLKMVRLFYTEPEWKAINRPAENHPARMKYLGQVRVA